MERRQADTIAAPITAPGSAAVSVVRLSGDRTRAILSAVAARADAIVASPRELVFTAILDPAEASPLDHGLVAFFPNPSSFTGEDSAEFHLHGSPYVVRRLLEALQVLGARSARPGEFTERAFHNGKMDLAQAEAIADLVGAETELQARVAREQLEGRLSGALSELGDPLRDLLAEIEAGIDFPEEDVDPLTSEGWRRVLGEAVAALTRYIDSYRTGRICRDGASVVIAGLPNAGKSSLLNRLVGSERAIVTPVAGTTRDTIEEWVSIDGMMVRLWDTAGLPFPGYEPDPIEKLGIEISRKKIEQADLVVFVVDLTSPPDPSVLAEVSRSARRILVAGNKADASPAPIDGLRISAKSGEGIEALKTAIRAALIDETALSQGSILVASERHREALAGAREQLHEAQRSIDAGSPAEITAHAVRSALVSMNEILGVTTTEDILGRIFSKFCIGK